MSASSLDRDLERSLVETARATGYDAVITDRADDTIFEIIVLDEAVIRLRDQDVGQLGAWPSTASEPLLLRSCSIPSPAYAPDCVVLSGLNDRASRGGQSVAVYAPSPIYCDRSTWPMMNFDILRACHVGCLVDPRDGDALVLADSIIEPLNRSALREMRAKAKRRGR